jgi:hypothetical protein
MRRKYVLRKSQDSKLSMTPKFHSQFNKIFPLVSILSVIDYVRILLNSFKISENTIIPTFRFTKWPCSFSFTHRNPLHHTHYMPRAYCFQSFYHSEKMLMIINHDALFHALFSNFLLFPSSSVEIYPSATCSRTSSIDILLFCIGLT